MTKKSFDDYVNKKNKLGVYESKNEGKIIKTEQNEVFEITDYEDEKKKMGFISRAQLSSANNRYLLDVAKLEYAKRLEVYTKKITGAAKIASKTIDKALELELDRIDKEYLAHIEELKAGNYETRTRIQMKLASISQNLFDEIRDSDLADFLKEDIIKRMLKERTALADEIGETTKY